MYWKKTIWTALTAVSLMCIPVSVVSAAPSQQNLDTLTQVYTLLVDEYYTHPDENALLQAAISGMLSQINDPFTTYFTPEQYKQFTEALNQSYAGIGVVLEDRKDGQGITINSVFKNSPADKAGLQVGDRILQVDNSDVSDQTVQTISGKMIGSIGTNLTLKIEHADNSIQSYTITRSQIELPEVISQDLGSGIGYLRIFSFGDRTTEEFEQQFQTMQKCNPKGLVLDLRGNGGGLVSSALQIADDLMQQGTIVIFHDQNGQSQAITADSAGSQIPIVVLVDRNTASASEMLAGALQKNKRAKLIGERTYGKGTMQIPTPLPNGGYLKVSIDRWDLADGTSPDHVGLTPDIHLTSPTDILNAAMQQLLPDRHQELTFSRNQGTAILNGNDLDNVPPIKTAGGQIYLPLRYTVEALGAEVDWVAAEQSVHFLLNGHQVSLDLKHDVLLIDGKSSHLTKPFLVTGGTSYLTTEAFQAITGQAVEIKDQAITIHVK